MDDAHAYREVVQVIVDACAQRPDYALEAPSALARERGRDHGHADCSHGGQWPVGHGGFFTGQVSGDPGGRPLNYVYDCGAMRRTVLTEAISRYEDWVEETSGTIDLVVLSHVDWDHVNGLQRLLNGNIVVGRIMLPLLTPLERLVALARSTTAVRGPDGPGGGSGPRLPGPFELGLVTDPVATIASVAAGAEVVFVTRESEPLERPSRWYLELDDQFSPLLAKTGFDHDIGMGLVGTGLRRKDSHAEPALVSHGNGIVIGETLRSRGLEASWLLSPYLPRRIVEAEERFLHSLAELLDFTAEKLRRMVEAEDRYWLTRLATEERPRLRRAYAAVAGGVNPTSLCLYSGPLPGADVTDWVEANDPMASHGGGPRARVQRFLDRRPRASLPETERAGILFTGDAELSSSPAIDELWRHYADLAEGVGVVHLPHHGSKYNFNPELLDRFRNARVVLASAPEQSRHHPAAETLDGVRSRGLDTHIVTTDGGSAIRTTAHVRPQSR